MVLTKYTGIQTLTGSEAEIFNVNKGASTIHFGGTVYLDELVSGDTVRVRVYDKKDGVGYWKFDGEVNDYVGSNNGTITYHTNLKRLYKFEQNLNDSTTSAANGTLGAGTATYVSGQEGSAFSFTGTEYITASDTGLQTVNGAWSVTGWIYPTSLAATRYIYSYGTNAANQAITIAVNSSGKIVIGNVTGALLTSASTLVINTWYHVEATYNGTTLTLYINGTSDSTATPAALNITLSGASGQHIGANIDNTLPFVGYIDELRNYNIALTQAQVSALYMVGKYGQSHTFDGGEYLTLGGVSTFNTLHNGTPFTISYWSKIPVGALSGTPIMIDNCNGGTLTNIGIVNFIRSTGEMDFQIVNGSGTAVLGLVASSGYPNDGIYHHVCFTFDGTTCIFYLDSVSTKTQAKTAQTPSTSNASFSLKIGIRADAAANPEIGQIDDFRIYNRGLSSSEVSDLYNNPQNLNSIVYDKSYSGAQSSKTLYIPIIQTNNYAVTLQQTAGNYYKTLDWSRIEIT